MTNLEKYGPLFCQNSQKLIAKLQDLIKILRENPSRKNAYQEGQRLAHTVKGSAEMMGCRGLAEVCRVMENIFIGFQKESFKNEKEIFVALNEVCELIISKISDFKKIKNTNFQKSISKLQKITLTEIS